MAIIRKNDYKEYVAFQKTVDDLYPYLPPVSGSIGVGLWTQYRTIYPSTSESWILNFEPSNLDTEFCLKYGDRWLNQMGASGLNFNALTKEFNMTTSTDVRALATMMSEHYNTKWQRLYDLMLTEYKPLDNWSGKEEATGDWEKNGTLGKNSTITNKGYENKSTTYEVDANNPLKEVIKYTDNTEGIVNEKTIREYGIDGSDYKETKHGGKSITSSQPTSIGRQYNNYTETNTTLESGGTVDEVLKSGFNSGVSGTHPAAVTTSNTGGQTVSGVDYVPETLEKITKSDGKNEKKLTGGYTDSITVGAGGESYTEGTYDGISGKYGDITTGGHSITNKGKYTEETVTTFGDGTSDKPLRETENDGSETYDLDGTDNKTIEYSGFVTKSGLGTRQMLGEQEWNFRRHLFLEEVFKDAAEFITLNIY